MVRIAAINYLNTIPFIYGLEACLTSGEIAMQFCTPAESALLLRSDKADVGIMPVGAIASIIEVKEESDIDSFLSGGQVSFLADEIKGLDDFELICFLVVR